MPDKEWYWREQQTARMQLRKRFGLPKARAFIGIPAELAQQIREAADAREREVRRCPPPAEPLTADGLEWRCWVNLDRARIALERSVADEIAALPPFNESAARGLMARLLDQANAHHPAWPWAVYNSLALQVGSFLLPQAVEPPESHSSTGYSHMAPHIAARMAALAELGLLVLAEPRGLPPVELYAPLFAEGQRRRTATDEHFQAER